MIVKCRYFCIEIIQLISSKDTMSGYSQCCMSNPLKNRADIKVEFGEPSSLEDREYPTLNNIKQFVDVKDELEIGNTLIHDGNRLVTNTELEFGIKSENVALNDSGFKYEGCEEDSDSIEEDGDSSTTGSDDDQNRDIVPTGSALKLKEFQCQFCVYSTINPYKMKEHIRAVHSRLKPYKCEHCDYTAAMALSLRAHVKVVHQKLKLQKCEYCDYSAIHASTLRVHVRSVHQKIKNFKCEFCDYSAARTSTLKIHIKGVHHNLRDHKCAYCDYSTSRVWNLKGHVKSVHQKLRDFKCEYCDFSAALLHNLNAHIRNIHKTRA